MRKPKRACRSDVREFVAYTGLRDYLELRSIVRAHIIGWRQEMEQRVLSPATIRRKLSALSSLFDYLCERNAIAGNRVDWSTLDSWSRSRRVIGKAEWTGGAANPRFVVTSLARGEHEARHLYEKVYCARGDMENRIKECQLDLFADRTSARRCAPTSCGYGSQRWLMCWFAPCVGLPCDTPSLPRPPAERSA